jgi:nucleoid-associated protein YgaU
MRKGSRHLALDRALGWLRSVQLPAVGAGLAAVELILVRWAGAPAEELRTLRQLGDAWADPLACVLALMTLAGEALVAYLLAVLVLRSLSMLPGTMGRVADRVASLVTPAAVRRTLDLVVGGALLAQAALALVPAAEPIPPAGSSQRVAAALWQSVDSVPGGLADPAMDGSLDGARSTSEPSVDLFRASLTGEIPPGNGSTAGIDDGTEPVETRPASRRASAPLPPWLGGGPSIAVPEAGAEGADVAGRGTVGADTVRPPGWQIVEPGDTLWSIAAAHLRPATRSASNIHRFWQQVYRANRPVVGPDPDLIHPGTRLRVPPYRLQRR